MKNLIKYIFIFSTSLSFSQSGYLGSVYNVQLNIGSVPQLFSYKYHAKDESTYIQSSYNLNLSYAISVSKVMNDNWQLGVSYKFIPMNLYARTLITETQSPTNPNLTDINNLNITSFVNVNYQSFAFNFRNFTNGISPIGKGWGMDFEYGTTIGNKMEVNANNADISNSTSNLFRTPRYMATPLTETEITDYSKTLTTEINVSAFIIKGYYGRTIPISKKIGIDLSMTFPILRVISFNTTRTFGLLVDPASYLNEFSTISNNKTIAYSVRKYNGLSFNVGIKYFL